MKKEKTLRDENDIWEKLKKKIKKIMERSEAKFNYTFKK